MNVFKPSSVLGLFFLSFNVNAVVITVEGDVSSFANCIPFGCPATYDPHMGFVYQNIESFTLNAGDIIAFDLGATNDKPLNFDISLAQTQFNGGDTANSNGFTTIVSNGIGSGQGNTILGDYDLAFTVDTYFEFSGGGLIIDFLALGESTLDNTADQVLVNSDQNDSSGYFVGRYYGSLIAGPGISDKLDIANFQITTSTVPVPAAFWLFAPAVIALAGFTRRKPRSS